MISFLLLAIIMPYKGFTAAAPASSLFIASESIANKHFVIFNIDKVQFLGKTGDVIGDGEFRLLILGADTKGRSSGLYCPGNKPIKIKQGDTVNSPCLSGFSFDEDTVSDGVFLTIIALDEDKSSLPADLSYEMVSNQLGKALEKRIGDGVFKVATATIPYAVPIQILTSLLTGKVKAWIEKADIVGSQGIYLSRQDGWSATGNAKTVESSDGGIKITYTITRSTSEGRQILVTPTGSPTKTSTTRPAKTAQPTPSNVVSQMVRISCQGIIEVNMRKSPGYINKTDSVDSIVKVPCGEYVSIIKGPENKDSLKWWYVSWNGYKGWIADHTGSGKVILLFN